MQRRSKEKKLERIELQETKDQESYRTLSQIVCYNDLYLIYYDTKIEAIQFPSIPKKKGRRQATYKINIIIRRDNLERVVKEDDIKSNPKEDDSNSKESKEELSNDD